MGIQHRSALEAAFLFKKKETVEIIKQEANQYGVDLSNVNIDKKTVLKIIDIAPQEDFDNFLKLEGVRTDLFNKAEKEKREFTKEENQINTDAFAKQKDIVQRVFQMFSDPNKKSGN